MNAVVVPFPHNARAIKARPLAIAAAVDERAKATNATLEQRSRAQHVAEAEYKRTGSAAWAIYQGKLELPPLERTVTYRTPQLPPEVA